MQILLLFGFLAGLDTLQVIFGIGLMPIRAARKWAFALVTALWQPVMPLLGLTLGRALHQSLAPLAEAIGPIILIVCGVAIIALALRGKDSRIVLDNNWSLIGMPFLLSIDDLFIGIGLGALAYPALFSALVIGTISGIMAISGLVLGRWALRWIPERAEIIGGVYLLVIATIRLWKEIA